MNLINRIKTFRLISKNVKNNFSFISSYFTSIYFNFILIKKVYFKSGLIFYIHGCSDINHLVEYMKGYYNINDIKFKSLVLDFGGSTGDFAIAMSKKADLIYVLEPLKAVYDILQKNIAINQIKNIRPYNLAISDVSTKRRMFLASEGTASARLSTTGNLVVDCISWKDFYRLIGSPKRIDLLKLDIEGGEYSLLQDNYILNFINEIRMELHILEPNHKIKAKQLINLFKDYNFKTNLTEDELKNNINTKSTFELILKKLKTEIDNE